jgi:hypothetical protein
MAKTLTQLAIDKLKPGPARREVPEGQLRVSGSFGGIVGIYQKHSFADEMRAALMR